jgi:hypothetical protein
MEGLTNKEYYRKHRYRAYENPKSHSSHGNNRQGFNGFNQFPPYFGNIILPVNLSNSSKLTDDQVFEIKKYIMSFSRFFNNKFTGFNKRAAGYSSGEKYTVLYNNLPEYAPDIKKSGPRPTIGIMGSVIGPEGLVSPYYKNVPVQNALMAYSMLLSSPLNGRNGETYGNRLDKIKKLGIEYEKIKKLLDEYDGSAKDDAAKSKISSYVVFTDDKLVTESVSEAKDLETMSDDDALKLLKDFKITPSTGASAGKASSSSGMGKFPPTGTLTDAQFTSFIKVINKRNTRLSTDVDNQLIRLKEDLDDMVDTAKVSGKATGTIINLPELMFTDINNLTSKIDNLLKDTNEFKNYFLKEDALSTKKITGASKVGDIDKEITDIETVKAKAKTGINDIKKGKAVV